jgi:hypothetical protein
MHLFAHNFDHDYYFELLGEEERAAQSITRCSTAHHRLFRACPRANRTLPLVRNPIPCATLFGDMPQSPPIATRVLQRHQSQIACDLLPTLKPIRSPHDQPKSQCGQRTHSGMAHQALCRRTLLHFLLDRLAQFGDHRIQTVQQTPADPVGADSPREPTETTPVVPVPAPATIPSCSVSLRSGPLLAIFGSCWWRTGFRRFGYRVGRTGICDNCCGIGTAWCRRARAS